MTSVIDGLGFQDQAQRGGEPNMTVMTLDHGQHSVVLSQNQITAVALLVVLAMAVALTLLLAAPTVETLHFGDFRFFPSDLAHFAARLS